MILRYTLLYQYVQAKLIFGQLTDHSFIYSFYTEIQNSDFDCYRKLKIEL